jgi:uncharacterized heparinase superfamily protein
MLQRILRVLRTSRYLKLSQLYWFIRRRIIKTQTTVQSLPDNILRRDWVWSLESTANDKQAIAAVEFCFLNVSRSYPLAAIDWAPQDVNRLWRYNLHYFDFLLDSRRTISEKNYLINDWIHKNPLGSEPAWEPYTASLRIVNWIKFLSHPQSTSGYADALRSLYQQVLWLEQNLELHILANHYFENLKSLLFAGVFFQGTDADRWKNLAVAELEEQLREQILPDGCHYERTPQYHCVILDDVLDLLELTNLASNLFYPRFVEQLKNIAKRMSVFLADILNPLGQYPLFNDSAFYDVAPLDILRRAEQLLGEALVVSSGAVAAGRENAIVQHHAAGFYGYRAGNDWFMIDCGGIGPAYQPGHTHCDFLSYELMIGGIPLVVDTGVLEYEPGAMRHHVRSTAAHNTVQVDDVEQSEIWGEFRVARRARKRSAEIRRRPEGIVFEGSFIGFFAVGEILHKRLVHIETDLTGLPVAWNIKDVVSGKGGHRLRSYIHLHPEITPVLQDEKLSFDYDGKSLACLIVSPSNNANPIITIEASTYCPEFGRAVPSHVVMIEMQTELPTEFGYTIRRSGK